MGEVATKLEPFITAKQVVESGLFPGLNEEKLKDYVRKGLIQAHGPSNGKTYLLSEVYEGWKNIQRRQDTRQKSKMFMVKENYNGGGSLSKRSRQMASGLQKAWRPV